MTGPSVRWRRRPAPPGSHRLEIVADAPSFVVVVPLEGTVAVTRLGTHDEKEALLGNLVDRGAIGEAVLALLEAKAAEADRRGPAPGEGDEA